MQNDDETENKNSFSIIDDDVILEDKVGDLEECL